MAAADKLWFELGVRDEISKVLENLMRNSEKLADMLTDDAVELKNVYKNILDISNVYDKIYVTQKRISDLKGAKTLTADEKKGLKEMSKELENVRKEFSAILKNPERATSRGEAQFEKTRLNIELMLKDTLRYVDNIEAKERAEAQNAINESKRIDDLKAKYYELQRYRKQLSDAIVGATPGTDISGSVSLINSISARMSAVKRAERNGGGMPMSASGPDYEEFLRRVKTGLSGLTSATNDYNNRLETNKQIQSALNKLSADAISQQKIAGIRGQVVEYNALGQKIQEINNLLANVQSEHAGLYTGRITTPTYTREKITEELNAFQRRYNESVAQGIKMEQDDRIAKQQLTEASRQLIAQQQGLVSAFDKVTEAGKRTNALFDQIKSQTASAISLYAMEGLLKSVIQVGGEFEVQHIALQSILGDLQQANTMFNEIKQLAVVSPFNFSQLIAYSKQIAAFGIPYEEMYDTTKRLADMSAGLGVDMSRLILAYGQVRSAAVLRGQELRQFTEAGIPMVQALADEFTRLNGRVTTTGEVFELISKRAVPFEMVKKVLWDMTNEGGRFFNMQFTLADTLAGKWSNLEDAWQIMLSEFAKGESLGGRILKTFVQGLTDFIEALDKIGPLIGGFGMARLGRYIQGGFSSYLGNDIERNVIKAQKLHAIELKRRYLNMEITREQYNQGIAMNSNRQNYYMLLAQEGRLKEYQIARAIQQGKINVARIQERVLSGEITTREAAQLRLWRMKYAQASVFSLKLKEIGLSVKTMMGPFGWISLAIDGIVMGLTSWYMNEERISDKMKETSDNFTNSARDREREIRDSLKDYETKSPINDSEYQNAIDVMKEQLKQYDANYGSIMREVDSLNTLNEKYEKLKEELSYVAESYELAGKNRAEFDELQKKTSALSDSSKEWATDNDHLNRSLNTLAADGSKDVEKAIDTLAVKIPKLRALLFDDSGARRKTSEILKDFADSLNFEEISDVLAGLRGRSIGFNNSAVAKYKSIFEDLNNEDREMFDKYLSDAQKRNNTYNKEIGDELEKIVESTYTQVAAQLGEKTEALKKRVAESGNNLDQRTKTMLRDYFMQQMSAITNGNQSLMNWVDSQRWTLYFHYDIVTDYNDKKDGLKGIAASAWGRMNAPVTISVPHKGFTEKDLKDAFGSEGNDVQNARTVLSRRIKEQKGVVDALKTSKDATEEQKKEAQELFNSMEADWNDMFTDSWKDVGKTKGSGGTKQDTALKLLENRIAIYKKFYSELENATKIYGSAALDYLKGNGFAEVFGWNLGDVTNYRQSLDELTKGFVLNTEARRKFANSVDADKVSNQRKADADAISKINSELKTQLSMLGEQYDTYKRIYQLTGNKEGAINLAFGGGVQSATYKDELIRQMREALAAKPQGTMTAEDVFAMDKNTFAKTFGENSKIFSELYEAYAANEKKIKQETLQLLEETVSKNRTLAQQIDDENRRYERQLELIKQIKDPSLRQQAEQGATQEHDEKVAHLQFEQFKANTDWVKIFDDLDRVTTETLSDMMNATEQFGHTAGLSVEDVKALENAIAKIRNELANRNPFFAMSDALSRMRILNRAEKTHANGDIAGVELGNVLGVDPNTKVTKKQIKDGKRAAGSDFTKGVEGLRNKFDALAGALDPVIKLFDELGMKEVGQIFGAAQGALGGAATGALGATALFGASAGPWGAAIGAGVSILGSAISALFGGHDEALEEEIKASKRRQKEMENLTKNLETVLEHTLGSLYVAKADQEVLDKMKEYTSKYELRKSAENNLKNGSGSLRDYFDVKSNQYIQDRTYEAIKEAEKSQSYYDTQKAALMIQQDELRSQIASEEDKKETDWDKIQDMQQQIKDLEMEIRYFAEEMAKDLYGIDYKSWAAGLADALVDAWASGENAVDAYKKKVSEMIKEVGTKIIAQKYLEPLLQKNMEEFMEYFEANDGRMDERGLEILAKMYDDADKAARVTSAFLDGVEQIANRHGDTIRDDSGSSASSSIKNITESTADLLASYINAIRADVSVNKATLMQLLTIVQGQSEMPVIARAQLVQLEQIARNTNKNANFAEDIYNLLHSLAPDGQGIKIK